MNNWKLKIARAPARTCRLRASIRSTCQQCASGVLGTLLIDRVFQPAKHTEGQVFREELYNALRKLIPVAAADAKKGKPSLLRILTRLLR